MKITLISIILLAVTLSCTIENANLSAENGKLSGIVTYRDSYVSANQADEGCEIYALNEADARSTQFANIMGVVEIFKINKSIYSSWVNTTLDPGKIKKAQDLYDTSANVAFRYLRGFRQLPTIVRATTNGTGNFALSLKPGKYYILVVSGSVKSNNVAEIKGNIDIKMADIKPAGETFLNINFEKHEMTGIRRITAMQPSGC